MDLDALTPSPECPAEQLQKLKLAIPEVWMSSFHTHSSLHL